MIRAILCLYLIQIRIFGVYVANGHAEEQCELTALSSEVGVPYKEWVLLNCTFTCSDITLWEGSLQKKNPESGPNWTAVEVLVDNWDKSELYCMQVSDDGSTRQSMSQVMAYALPRHVTIELVQELEEGTAHSIDCMVYDVAPVGNLQILLLRNDIVIQRSTFKADGRKGKQMVNVTYEVTASRMDNGQNFYCQATLEVTTGNFITVNSSGMTVRTYGPPGVPVVTITPESNIRKGDSFNITCISDGSPIPEYHWIVPTGANVTYTRNKSIVSVSRAGQTHTGVYTCEARNEHGRVSASRSVQVTPLMRGWPHSHEGAVAAAAFVFIITPFILWKTRNQSSVPGSSD
ncbi:vascular cell adhesion protein 1-like [Eleutherodactylus coqui]|uniref:vascular cell adhesion protein 1-like n=1 Tax=Eleutherodactylus coqui TaxID=57060 RepID=UPI00346270B5